MRSTKCVTETVADFAKKVATPSADLGSHKSTESVPSSWKRKLRMSLAESHAIGSVTSKRKGGVGFFDKKKLKLAVVDDVFSSKDGTDLTGELAEAVEQPRREL